MGSAPLVALLLSGCGVDPAGLSMRIPRQDEAVRVIWVDAYRRGEEPPAINWVTGEALNCTQPESGRPGFYALTIDGYRCLGGVTYVPTEVAVAWSAESTFCTSTLAHEFKHAAHAWDGVFDPRHERADWAEVPLVNEYLASLGLCE